MMKNIFDSKRVPSIILILSILLVILLIFQAGYMVGYRKGSFVSNWSNRYRENFSGPKIFMGNFMHRGDEINPHGAVGQIISNNLPRLIIKGPDRAEEVIVIDTETVIRSFRNIASTSELIAGKEVVVIGEPNERGEIIAKLIRIMPDQPSMMSSGTSLRNYKSFR